MDFSKYAFIFFMITMIFSCSSNDDSNDNEVEVANFTITGDWNLTNFEHTRQYTTASVYPTGEIIVRDREFYANASDIDYTLSFSEDPNTYNSQGLLQANITSGYVGQEQNSSTFPMETGLMYPDGVTWTLSENTLKFFGNNVPGGEQIYEVVILDEDTLELTREYTFSYPMPSNDPPPEHSSTYTIEDYGLITVSATRE